MKSVLIVCSLFLMLLGSAAFAQSEPPMAADSAVVDSLAEAIPPPAPISGLEAFDTDNDHGHSITLRWELSPDDGSTGGSVLRYDVYRWKPALFNDIRDVRSLISAVNNDIVVAGTISQEMKERRVMLHDSLDVLIDRLPEAHAKYPEGGSWDSVGTVSMGTSEFVNAGAKERTSVDYLPDFTDFYYRVDAVTKDPAIRSTSSIVGPVQSRGQWFNTGRTAVFIAVIIFGLLTIWFVERARRGAELYVRPLAGIEAVDDAIGRATEMGRPILYVLGLGTAADVATIASFTILGRVAKRVAEYQTPIIVPTYDPIVMSVAQEVVKSAYMDAGRPDEYDENSVFFVTNLQFAYVAAVNGIMLRQLPATNVYMGKFFAESLILAETGALAGSIQISGTDEIAQIPFFIVACDYTLIGEELYAASAYLGREPILLGSLKAQDWAKAAVIVLSIVGLIAACSGWITFTELFHVTN